MNKRKKILVWIYKNKSFICFFISLLINFILFAHILIQNNSYFITNDDYRMRLILSGAYTGTPNYQVVFMKSGLSSLIQGLYNINRTVPWYDIFTVMGMFIPSTYVLYRMINEKKVKALLINIAVYLLFYYFILSKHLLLPQFTTTAAFCGMGAISALIYILTLKEKNKKLYINSFFFLISSLLCFCIRDEVFILLIVLELFIITVNYIINHDIRKFCITLIVIISTSCFIIQSIDFILLGSKNYKDFREFTKARSNIYDYYAASPYEENEEFYNSIKYNEDLVSPVMNRTLDVDDLLNTENYKKIADYSKSNFYETSLYDKLKSSLTNGLQYFISENIFPQTLFILFIGIYAIISAILNKSKINQIYVLAASGYILLSAILLLFRGRLIERVIESIFLLCIPIFCVQFDMNSKIKERQNCFSSILIRAMVFCIIGVYLTSSFYIVRDNKLKQAERINLLSSRLTTITNYVKENKSNFYFYNALDFIGGSDKLFNSSFDYSSILNMDSLGNWNAKSPSYYARNKSYGFTSAIDGLTKSKNVFYIETGNLHCPFLGLLENKYKKTLKRVEYIQSPDEMVINIYKVVDLNEEKEKK